MSNQDDLAMNIFLALVGERPNCEYIEEDEIRSAPYTDTVDVKLGDQWYRISSAPIAEPISVKAHRNESE
jgi:hypothetical protein